MSVPDVISPTLQQQTFGELRQYTAPPPPPVPATTAPSVSAPPAWVRVSVPPIRLNLPNVETSAAAMALSAPGWVPKGQAGPPSTTPSGSAPSRAAGLSAGGQGGTALSAPVPKVTNTTESGGSPSSGGGSAGGGAPHPGGSGSQGSGQHVDVYA